MEAANHAAVCILTSLGYFLNFAKSVFVPVQHLVYLGLCCDSTLTAFSPPYDKIQKFAELREQILSEQSVSLVSIQKIIGKCISFSLVVPAAKLFTREMDLAVSRALKSRNLVKITGSLRKELEYWRFFDTWEGHITWREEAHVSLSLASDASDLSWGGALLNSDGQVVQEVGDSWCETMRSSPIHVRETVALSRTLLSLSDVVRISSRGRSGRQFSALWLLGKAVRQLSFYAGGLERSFLDDSEPQCGDLPAAR